MPFINFTNPISVLVALILFLLILFLAKHTKKSMIMGIMLFVFLAIITGHVVELTMMEIDESLTISTLATCITVDFVFILLCYMSYLWIDDIEAKEMKKRSIDNSLDWFWSKV